MTRQISLAEVRKHNTNRSVWMVIHDDVYDVTKFLNEHPGGEDTLMDVAGQDGTEPFEDVGHSEDAREILKKFKIGTLPASERNKVIADCCPSLPKLESQEKTWRTFDGGPSSYKIGAPKSDPKLPSPRALRRVQSIVVPRESSKLKWALWALAGAIILGIIIKKYSS